VQSSESLAESVQQARLGGHGLRLMRHYLSAMSYRRLGEVNCLILTVDIGPQADSNP
jgi:serine/threonine-protein kinase RsbW